jgi:hypothetical protein
LPREIEQFGNKYGYRRVVAIFSGCLPWIVLDGLEIFEDEIKSSKDFEEYVAILNELVRHTGDYVILAMQFLSPDQRWDQPSLLKALREMREHLAEPKKIPDFEPAHYDEMGQYVRTRTVIEIEDPDGWIREGIDQSIRALSEPPMVVLFRYMHYRHRAKTPEDSNLRAAA